EINGSQLSFTTLNVPPVADFMYSPVNPTTSDTVQFTDASTDIDGTITAWAWNFGDGSTSAQQSPTHKYAKTGTYTVTLKVTDDAGGTDTVSKAIAVANVPPIADFEYSPSNPTTANTVQFTDKSTDSDGTIVSWTWDFDDGNTSAQQNLTHKYAKAGTYTVALKVTDDVGGTHTVSKDIAVANVPPVADFTYSPANPMTSDTVQFADKSTDPDGSITSWAWDFENDGIVDSTEQNPTHQYTTEGTHNVKLTVTDNDGASGYCEKVIEVSPLVVITNAATLVKANTAALNMNYDMQGLTGANVQFKYKKAADTEWTFTIWVAKTGAGSYLLAIKNLEVNTDYEFAAMLKQGGNEFEGSVLTFTTPLPTVTTRDPTLIKASTATLNMGYDFVGITGGKVQFKYKTDSDSEWTFTNWVAKSNSGSYPLAVKGLTPGSN
ncbi:MAG: hypothetical protein CVT48_06205, partial [Thermoplasmata archaeon HGW-Thermoplasmata-1]